MEVTYQEPHPILRPFIYSYGCMQGPAPVEQWMQPIIPSMLPYMVIRFSDLSIDLPEKEHAHTPAVFIMGLTSSMFQIGVQKTMDFITIHFTPDGLYRLCGIPSHYFSDKLVNYEDIDATNTRLLLEQLAGAGNHAGRYEVLDRFFVKLFHRKLVKSNALEMVAAGIQSILHHGGTMPVNKLAAELCYSKRNVERRFHEVLGVSPKAFSKVIRFNASMKQLVKHHPKVSVEEIAWQMGYHDLSHFGKEFKQLYRKTPYDFCYRRDAMEESCLTMLNVIIPTPVIPDWNRAKRSAYYVP
jgi:AraC-like DNA-binding protein